MRLLCARRRLDEIDPGFVEALQERGTRFFLPDTYNDSLNYSLPSRWYGGDENFSENVSTNMTDMSRQPGTLREPYDNLENNASEYIPEPDEDPGIQGSGYRYIPEPDERSENNSENNGENNSENNSVEWSIPEAS